MRKYEFSTQVRLVCATMAIHNFIRRKSQSDIRFKEADEDESLIEEDNCHQNQEASLSNFSASSFARMNRIRDRIRDRIVEDI